MSDESEALWRRHVVALLVTLATVLASAELAARYVVPKISSIESRTMTERAQSFSIAPLMEGQRTLLLVGNSLMQTGINLPILQREMQPSWRVQRFIVEGTYYNDWYFELSNMLESGSRPSAIVLMLSSFQLLSDRVRGPNTAYHLFSALGSVKAGMAAGYHLTDISGMLVGHFSAYYGLHEEIHKVIFEKLIPGALPMTEMMLPRLPATDASSIARIQSKGVPRLAALRALCDRFAVKCIFVVPPAMHNGDEELVKLTDKLGLGGDRFSPGFGVENRAPDGSWPSKFFTEDHFHYSPEGAVVYTELLGQALRGTLQ